MERPAARGICSRLEKYEFFYAARGKGERSDQRRDRGAVTSCVEGSRETVVVQRRIAASRSEGVKYGFGCELKKKSPDHIFDWTA